MTHRDHTVTLASRVTDDDRKAEPQLFLLLECERPCEPSTRHLLAELDRVVVGRGGRSAQRATSGGVRTLDLRIPDRALSETHATLQRLHGRWLLEDRASKNGTRINGKTTTRAVLADGDLIEVGGTFLLFRDAVAPAPAGQSTFHGALAEALDAAARVAPSVLPVLILGATGTGKELVARGVHAGSRRGGELIAVNCAALPANLVEAALFGHRRGSFTGAVEDRPGFVASAHRGTLFLDEIADLPLPAQGALLRFLQEGEVTAIGETHAASYDVRVVAATHRDLPALARQGSFREDLLARLQGLTVRLPPLCERREDLGLLIASLLGRLAPAATFTPPAARALLSYGWPQNVRELELALSAASILAGGGAIDLPHVPATVRQVAAERAPAPPPRAAVELSAEDAELREAFLAQLREHRGNVAAVARAMGKGRMQIHRWLKRFGVDLDAFRR